MMTNEMKSFKGYLSGKRLRLSIVAIVLGILMFAPLAAATKPIPYVLPVDSKLDGKTYGEWGAEWWKWAFSIPVERNPLTDANGNLCAEGQSGNVWFIGGVFGEVGSPGDSLTRSCTIPAGKALFFPIINYETTLLEEEYANTGRDTEEELLGNARETIDGVTALEVKVDGKPLKNLWDYRAESGFFTLKLPLNSLLDSVGLIPPHNKVVTTKGVCDGYWIMLAPLPIGEHTIYIYGEHVSGFKTEVTYNLNVVRGGPTK